MRSKAHPSTWSQVVATWGDNLLPVGCSTACVGLERSKC